MQDRELFFSHIGQSAQVNAGTYQRPLAVQAMLKVSRHLVSMDKGKTCGLSCSDHFAVGLIFILLYQAIFCSFYFCNLKID